MAKRGAPGEDGLRKHRLLAMKNTHLPRSFLPAAVLGFALAIGAAKLPAASIVDFANPGTVLNNGTFTLGFTFQVNSTISVDGLGFFGDG